MDALPIFGNAKAQLETLAKVEPSQLNSVADVVETLSYDSSLKDIRKVFREKLGDKAEDVFIQAASLSALRDRDGESPELVFDALYDGVVDAGLPEIEAGLARLKKPLTRIISSEVLYVVFKAAKLFAGDRLHLHDCSIFCDARPVFDSRREKIVSYIISSSLHLVASDPYESERSMSIILRGSDLERLAKEIDRAQKKISELRSELLKGGTPSVITYDS